MSKRARAAADQEMFEGFTALLRQSASRAMERLKLHRPRGEEGAGADARAHGMTGVRGAGDVPALPPAPSTSYLSELVTGSGGSMSPAYQNITTAAVAASSSRAPTKGPPSMKPIDVLTIQFFMHYLPLATLPANNYVRLAQEVVTSSLDRVLQPRVFAKVPLSQLCESLVAEHTAAAMEATLRDAEEFVESREIFGEWLTERIASAGPDDEDDFDSDDHYDGDSADDYYGGSDGSHDRAGRGGHNDRAGRISSVDLAGILYESLEFWVRIRDFIHALSRGSAAAYACPLRPRYERELMLLLHNLAHTTPAGFGARPLGGGRTTTATAKAIMDGQQWRHGRPDTDSKSTRDVKGQYEESLVPVKCDPAVKLEPSDMDEDEGSERVFDAQAMVAAAAASAVASGEVPNETTAAVSSATNGDRDDDSEGSSGSSAAGGEDNGSPAYSNTEEANGKAAGSHQDAGNDHNSVGERMARRRREAGRRHRRDVAVAVLADVLALSHCRSDTLTASSTTTSAGTATVAAVEDEDSGRSAGPQLLLPPQLRARARGVQASFFAMVHARLGVMVSRDRLRQFGASAVAAPPPPLTVAQRNTQARLEEERRVAIAAAAAAAAASGSGLDAANAAAIGVPLDYVPDDQYYIRVLAQQQDSVGEDEEILKDEVVDYYRRRQQQKELQRQQQQHGNDRRPGAKRGGANASSDLKAPQPLVKPHRYCKVKTGFTWTQYNRTHYDSRTNPPPRMVLWYEFTLFYPALVNTKRDMRNIFHIEDTPKGPQDDYCLLVFSVGPPYEDVAYRIVRKQWDTRRGGVRISFDATGRYKLFFRFSNSNYRR